MSGYYPDDDDIGDELLERETRKDVSVPSLMRGLVGHHELCPCHICVEIAVDEERMRHVRRGRW